MAYYTSSSDFTQYCGWNAIHLIRTLLESVLATSELTSNAAYHSHKGSKPSNINTPSNPTSLERPNPIQMLVRDVEKWFMACKRDMAT